MIPSILLTCLAISAQLNTDTTLPDLVQPYKIVTSNYYRDGGTTSFEIVDSGGRTIVGGFDGRACVLISGGVGEPSLNSCTPWKLYLGAEHPAGAGGRLLLLYGEEERALIRVLDAALDIELTPVERRKLAVIDNSRDLPDAPRTRELWHLVRSTDRRKRTLAAIDQGLLDCPDCITSYFEVTGTARVRSVAFVDSSTAYEVALADSSGREFVISLPVDPPDGKPRPSGIWPREQTAFSVPSSQGPNVFRYRALHSFGAMGDRCALTTLLLAMETMNSSMPGATLRDEIMETLRWRMRRTVEMDATQ